MVLRQVRSLFDLGVIGELTDGQLLERFATSGGEAAERAFAALVERHGPMVLRICRHHLRDANDVEDAFQATFLVLVQRARSLWVEDSLAPWVHRVARRIAVRARANAARRRDHERRAAEARPKAVASIEGDDGLAALLHEEIDRLPERCRVPVVLCDLEGLTHEQAARHLSWPIGTVKSRLTTGRQRLRARLVRRGVAPVTLTVAMAARPASAVVPAALVESTARTARLMVAGATVAGTVPYSVALLMKGVQSAMFMTRIKFALLACGLIAGGAVVAAQQAGRTGDRSQAQPVPAKTAGPAASPSDDEAAVSQQMARVERELLEDEVEMLRHYAKEALNTRIRLEMDSSVTGNVPKGAVNAARQTYELAREAYLEKARALLERQRRPGGDDRPRPTHRGASAPSRESDDPSTVSEPSGPGARASGAAVGSIDMDAVFKRSEKIRQAHRRLEADREEAREDLAKREGEAKEIRELLAKFQPDSPEHRRQENRLAEIKGTLEMRREQTERDFTRRHAREAASLLGEIQAVIAEVARTKGFDYVIKVEALPRLDAEPSDAHAALNRSVLFANPHHDITEDVIRELNRRFAAAGDKGPH
jgi:RNA polymerase sigma factor (sigma-70 family)